MTIADLIEKLAKYPAEMEVVLFDVYDRNYPSISEVKPVEIVKKNREPHKENHHYGLNKKTVLEIK